MSAALLLSLLSVHFLALVSPGPDFFVVMHTATTQSRKEAVLCALGVTIGISCWALLSLLGLQLLFEKFPWLQKSLVIFGGCYLFWMALQIAIKSLSLKDKRCADIVEKTVSEKKAFLQGLFTNLSNAKAVIYFSSVFSAMVSSELSNPSILLLLILISAESFIWFASAALLLSGQKIKDGYHRGAKWIDRVSAGVFGSFGFALIISGLN